MAKKRLILKRNEIDTLDNLYKVYAVQFPIPLYKFIFDLNRILHLKLYLNRNKLHLKIQNKDLYFNNYVSEEDYYEPIRVFQNRISFSEQKHGELFVTENNFYLLPKFHEFQALIFIPSGHPFIFKKNEFSPQYFTFWNPLELKQINPHPVFPEIDLFS